MRECEKVEFFGLFIWIRPRTPHPSLDLPLYHEPVSGQGAGVVRSEPLDLRQNRDVLVAQAPEDEAHATYIISR